MVIFGWIRGCVEGTMGAVVIFIYVYAGVLFDHRVCEEESYCSSNVGFIKVCEHVLYVEGCVVNVHIWVLQEVIVDICDVL